MNMKLFCQNNRKRPDDVGYVSRYLLDEGTINWTQANIDLMAQITALSRMRSKLRKRVNQFFAEYKSITE